MIGPKRDKLGPFCDIRWRMGVAQAVRFVHRHRRAVRQYLHGPIVEADILPGASFVTSSSGLHWLKVREP